VIGVLGGEYTFGEPPLMHDYERHLESKATLIRRFDGSAFLLSPKAKKIELELGTRLEEIKAKARQLGWIIAIEHLHGKKRLHE
jgi:hypothetical protein